jgi:hypothetical protein
LFDIPQFSFLNIFFGFKSLLSPLHLWVYSFRPFVPETNLENLREIAPFLIPAKSTDESGYWKLLASTSHQKFEIINLVFRYRE